MFQEESLDINKFTILGMSSFLCKFLKKYFGEGYLPSLESVRFYQLLC